MDKTRLYHGLSAVFGGLALAWGAVQLSSSVTLTAGLFAVAGLGMLSVSVVALARPDLDSTREPATWKLVVLALGIVLLVAGWSLELL